MGILAFFAYWAIQGHIPAWPLVTAWLLGSVSAAVHYETKFGDAVNAERERRGRE